MAESLSCIGDFVHTITFNNAKEFAAHQDIAHALKAKIFSTMPYRRPTFSDVRLLSRNPGLFDDPRPLRDVGLQLRA